MDHVVNLRPQSFELLVITEFGATGHKAESLSEQNLSGYTGLQCNRVFGHSPSAVTEYVHYIALGSQVKLLTLIYG